MKKNALAKLYVYNRIFKVLEHRKKVREIVTILDNASPIFVAVLLLELRSYEQSQRRQRLRLSRTNMN